MALRRSWRGNAHVDYEDFSKDTEGPVHGGPRYNTEREAEDAARAAVDAAAGANNGRRSATLPFRRNVLPLRKRNARGKYREIKKATWDAKRIQRGPYSSATCRSLAAIYRPAVAIRRAGAARG